MPSNCVVWQVLADQQRRPEAETEAAPAPVSVLQEILGAIAPTRSFGSDVADFHAHTGNWLHVP